MKPNYRIWQNHSDGSLFEVYNYEIINEVYIISWHDPKNLKQNKHSVGVWKPKAK